MANFVPNASIKIRPSEPEWLNGEIKSMLKKQNRIYKKYKSNGFRDEDKLTLDVHRSDCAEAIEKSKHNLLNDLGKKKLAEKGTGQKTYWKIVNNLLNKYQIPHIPNLLVANKFVINCKEKAAHLITSLIHNVNPFKTHASCPILIC